MIYCVEDEGSIRDLMLYTLNMAGFEAQGFASSEPFWDAMKNERPELILLDIMLPGEDGIAVLRRLRSSPVTADIPVIMATAKGSEYDRVVGLDLGADDYLSKPFGMMEMVSRIKAVLRRANPRSAAPAVLSLGEISLDPTRHSVSSGGRPDAQGIRPFEAPSGAPGSGVYERASVILRLGLGLHRREPHGGCAHRHAAHEVRRCRTADTDRARSGLQA